MNNYYVYTLAYPDGTVFYVGKGKDKRIKNHLEEVKRGVISPKCDVIRSILASGQEVLESKVYTDLSEQEALIREEEVIDRYDFMVLTNKRKRGHCKWITAEWRDHRSKTEIERHRQRKPKASKWVSVEILLPIDVVSKIKQSAKSNGRSFDKEIVEVLRAHGVDLPQSMQVIEDNASHQEQ